MDAMKVLMKEYYLESCLEYRLAEMMVLDLELRKEVLMVERKVQLMEYYLSICLDLLTVPYMMVYI